MYVNESPGGVAPDLLLPLDATRRASMPIHGLGAADGNWRPYRNGLVVGSLLTLLALAYSKPVYKKVTSLLPGAK